MRLLLIALIALVLVGCSSGDTTVTVGEPGKSGVVKNDIDRSRAVAHEATSRIQTSDKQPGGE